MKNSLIVLLFALFLAGSVAASPIWEIPISEQQVEKWDILESLSHDSSLVVAVLCSPDSRFRGKSTLILYRLAPEKEVTEIWRTAYPDDRQGTFSDFAISDLDQNGRPEICLTLNNDVVPRGQKDIDWLRLYEWNGSRFPNTPTSRITLSVNRFSRVQPVKVIPANYTHPKKQELAVLFRGSLRKIFLFQPDGELSRGRWKTGQEIFSSAFLSEAGFLSFTTVHWDRAPLADILFYMQNPQKKSYDFTLVTLQDGKSVEKASLSTQGQDFNAEELRCLPVKPLKSDKEDILLINRQNRGAFIANDPEKGLRFFSLKLNRPYTHLGTDGQAVLSYHRDSVRVWRKEENNPSYQLRQTYHLPFVPNAGYQFCSSQTQTYAAGLSTGKTSLFITTLQTAKKTDEEILVAADQENMLRDLMAFLEEEKEIKAFEPDSIPGDDTLKIADPEVPGMDIMTRVRLRRMTFDEILQPGDTFSKTIELDRLDPGTLNLEWIAPEGAVYNLRSGKITWEILPEQLDSHAVYLSISDQNDTTHTLWSVYVNDPVKIVNREKMYTTNVNKPLSFQVEVKDRNAGAEFFFEWNGPDECLITKDGEFKWTPGPDYLDVNIVSIRVSDGFSSDSARFMIYVNDPVKIVSSPPSTVLPVSRQWRYPVTVEDNNDPNIYEYSLEKPVALEPEELLERKSLLVNRENTSNKTVNVRPFIKNIYYYDRYILVSLHEENPQDVNLGEILAALLQKPVKNLPSYTVQQIKTLRFTMDDPVPDGMEISQKGLLRWLPDTTMLDSHRITIRVNDQIASHKQILDLYVNSPPVITSEPKDAILSPGDIFTYHCIAKDKNTDAGLRYSIGKDSPPAEVDSSGHVMWRVGEDIYDYQPLTVIADDGFARDSVRMMLYINDPVKITPPGKLVAFTDSLFTCQLKADDKNASHLYHIHIEDEDGVKQIKTQIKSFLNRRSVPVLKKDTSADTTALDVRPAVRRIYYVDQDLYLDINPDYAKIVPIRYVFAGILGQPVDYLPDHQIRRDKHVEFSLIKGPEGLQLSPEGKISWKPKPFQFGSYAATVRATDAMASDTLTFEIFVNSPPYIVSKPEVLVHQGDVWQYRVETEDLNAEQTIEHRLLSAPEGVRLYSDTQTLMWSPTVEQKGYKSLDIEVSDGYQADRQTFQVFVNIPPEITSRPVTAALTGYDYEYQITAEDLNGDKIHFEGIKLPRWAELDPKTGLITWKPRRSEEGPNAFRIHCVDSHEGRTVHAFEVQVFESPDSKRKGFILLPIIGVVGAVLTAVILL